MSKKSRRRLDAGLKAKVALEALRNEATIAELAAKYQLHPNQIYARKKQLLGGAAAVFAGGTGKEAGREAEVKELYAKIGRLTVERDFYDGGPGDEPGRACGDGRSRTCRSIGAAAICAAGTGALPKSFHEIGFKNTPARPGWEAGFRSPRRFLDSPSRTALVIGQPRL